MYVKSIEILTNKTLYLTKYMNLVYVQILRCILVYFLHLIGFLMRRVCSEYYTPRSSKSKGRLGGGKQ